jgi:hypothetical protein
VPVRPYPWVERKRSAWIVKRRYGPLAGLARVLTGPLARVLKKSLATGVAMSSDRRTTFCTMPQTSGLKANQGAIVSIVGYRGSWIDENASLVA